MCIRDRYRHAANGVHDVLEAIEINLNEVIDFEPRECPDRLYRLLGAPERMRGVYLVVALVTRDHDPGVPGDGYDGGLLAVAAHTHQLYTSDAADDLLCVDLGGRRIIKKKNRNK